MIIVFTANKEGGIVQFATQLFLEVNSMGIECRLFVPENTAIYVPDTLRKLIHYYMKRDTISNFYPCLSELKRTIVGLNPEFVWYADASIWSSELNGILSGKVPQLLTVHDPANHPSRIISFNSKIKTIIEHHLKLSALGKTDKVLLLSNESDKKFQILYPDYIKKTITINLGAHIPNVVSKMPPEFINIESNYYLFFGRIDQYKGIDTMLKAYSLTSKDVKLVVAGRGVLSSEEAQLIKENDIICINRYIQDNEMIWLFENCIASVLPYIEASQSGIIPISYKYGKPVIVTNIEGLTQFVEDGVTGIICKDADELSRGFQNVMRIVDSENNCKKYYKDNLDWGKSIQYVFNKMQNR